MAPKLTPISSPRACYGLSQDTRNPECKLCSHFSACFTHMGTRARRVTLDRLTFDLVPPGLHKLPAAGFDPEQDINALYQSSYRLVYGTNPNDTLGKFTPTVLRLARQAKVSVSNFITISMVGYSLAWPDKAFTPGCLTGNQALSRVKTYAQACLDKFGTVDLYGLDALTNQNNAQYSLRTRMLNTEVTVGKWIIEWKLDNEGPPYSALFDALEQDLDVNWLAIEPRYAPRLQAYTQTANATANSHSVALKMRVLKKRKHESYANFVYRQMVLPEALKQVLSEFSYMPTDFERVNEPVTDALQFWHRLALAIQHVECLKWIDLGTGYYAKA